MTTTAEMIEAQVKKITEAVREMQALRVHLSTLPIDEIARRVIDDGVDLDDVIRIRRRVATLADEQDTALHRTAADTIRIVLTLNQLADLSRQALSGIRY